MLETWTIFTTLITCAVVGVLIVLGSIALIVHADSKARKFRKTEQAAYRYETDVVDPSSPTS